MSTTSMFRPLIAPLEVAAVFTYFLLFDQFGFLHHVRDHLTDPVQVKQVMTAMGVAGLAFSFFMVYLLNHFDPKRLRIPVWAFCGLVALVAPTCTTVAPLLVMGFLIGASTGMITILVAATVLEDVPLPLLGRNIGAGTALAYVLSNIPGFFESGLTQIASLSAFLCLIAIMLESVRATPLDQPLDAPTALSSSAQLGMWMLAILVLVGLDASAFAMIQQDDALKAATWGAGNLKWGLGTAHAVGALFAGWLIDRGFRLSLAVATWLLFAIAFAIIPHGTPDAYPASLLYAVGISTYSVLLVAAPSFQPFQPFLHHRARAAAWIFGVSGWLGSALGIGLAQERTWLPSSLIYAAGLILLTLWVVHRARRYRVVFPVFARTALVLAAATLWMVLTSSSESSLPMEESLAAAPGQAHPERGKAVYVEEGCINCHSQYIRPRNEDVVRWGPYRPINRSETPPMVGNRRQGPDLSHAGLRRSPDWHRLHLQDPASISAGSRMPSYAHLFADGDTRGDDLVAYLGTLGVHQQQAYFDKITAWEPANLAAGSAAHGRELYQAHCVQCHGQNGMGDGPLAALLPSNPAVLRYGQYGQDGRESLNGPLGDHLARIIFFGRYGTVMPGHEALNDQYLADLVQFIGALQRKGQIEQRRNEQLF